MFHNQIFPLGDVAALIHFGNEMDETINRQIIALSEYLNQRPIPGIIEVVPAFSSLAVYYDPVKILKNSKTDQTIFDTVADRLNEVLKMNFDQSETSSPVIRIPVCYDKNFAPDLDWIAAQKQLTKEEVTGIHTAKTYRVYMLGFLPGFAYMGKVDDRIAVPRKDQPRQKVEAGSVGIAGNQTGIYPLNSPGGWQIIGRTPLKLFMAANNSPVMLKAGDRVQFYSISFEEYLKTAALHP